jgi:hypothetical protein
MQMYGQPRGFTRTPEIRAILDPYEERDRDGELKVPEDGDIVAWEGLTVDGAIRLAELLPEWHSRQCQNMSPSVREMIQLGRDHPGTRFHGYRVPPEREDERISFEGFLLPVRGVPLNHITDLAEQLKPDEFCSWSCDGEPCYRFWWD